MGRSIIIEYPAIHALKRHRTNRFGKMYDASRSDKNSVLSYFLLAKQKAKIIEAWDFPILAICIFEKRYKKGRESKNFLWDTKPDIDNLEKFIFDVAEDAGIIKNDSRIALKLSRKLWGKNDRTILYMARAEPNSILYCNSQYVGDDNYCFSMFDRYFKKQVCILD